MSFAGAPSQMNTTPYQNDQEKDRNEQNLHLKPHDHQINFVNIDLHHQYGISVAESQTFLLKKHPQVARSEEKQMFFAG